jgi:hypothetical protein
VGCWCGGVGWVLSLLGVLAAGCGAAVPAVSVLAVLA